MREYTGSVTGIELNLIRRGYVLHNLEIVKREATAETPPAAETPDQEQSRRERRRYRG